MSITRRLGAISSFLAAALLLALAWPYLQGRGWGAWSAALGGALLAVALIRALLDRCASAWGPAWRQRRQARRLRKAMARLDWKVLQGGAKPRQMRDCEKEGTLGVCTGLECYFWRGCNFNLKKPDKPS
jgi:hypothetical protein